METCWCLAEQETGNKKETLGKTEDCLPPLYDCKTIKLRVFQDSPQSWHIPMGQRSIGPDFIAYKHLDVFEVIVPVLGLSQGQTRSIKNDSCGIGVHGPLW